MYVFTGLGNPGDEYRTTRHNIGRETALAAQKKFGLPTFTQNSKRSLRITEGTIGKERVAFVLPETFVNKSGNAVAPALRYYKVKPKNFVLIHDDVDMLLGRTKLSFGRNSGGHKGVESVMRALKTKNFWRMRIGVQKKRRVPGEDLVLQKFRGQEERVVQRIIGKGIRAIEDIARNGPEYAMNAYNQS